MKHYGVAYDVGLRFVPDQLSVESFDPALVAHDMQVIASDLHANTVRIEGEKLDRLETASRLAHAAGLKVFFNPWLIDTGLDEIDAYLGEAAVVAEKLRDEGVDIVFVTGCEISFFANGIFPGDSYMDRGAWLGGQFSFGGAHSDPSEELVQKSVELNAALRRFVETTRKSFKGRVTYSAGAWEFVDWEPFDIVGIDHYRRGESEEEYVGALDAYRRAGKELIVMEVGCCAYEGAAVKGDGGFAILRGVNADGTAQWENGVAPTRSEREQADYVGRQLDLLKGKVDGVFVYVFSFPTYPLGEGPNDLDMVNFAIVKTYPAQDSRSRQMPPWEPKESFHRVAEGLARIAVS
ncbi:hypothetical protein [Streptomyces hainanensis]|uniref:Abortive infection protein n=1 Tax=Streptomyces hainanensis TaxID=402648 RepID=A0A4R4U1V4_9ACTN|nr:hypothetical protein [Streptomyces hainanensis]TDC80499.1 hypothetical protein E1283_00085 [Streptomyces hainanensis]